MKITQATLSIVCLCSAVCGMSMERAIEKFSHNTVLANIKQKNIAAAIYKDTGDFQIFGTNTGSVSYSHTKNGHVINVAFYEVQNPLEWVKINNASFLGTDLKNHKRLFKNDAGRVHTGILNHYNQYRNDIMSRILSIVIDHDLDINQVHFNVTGHGLGGALGSIAAVDLANAFCATKERISLTTIDSPRVYNGQAATIVEEKIEAFRLWSENDIASALNLGRFGYKHIGCSLKYKSETSVMSSIAKTMLASVPLYSNSWFGGILSTTPGFIAMTSAVSYFSASDYMTKEHSLPAIQQQIAKGSLKPHVPLASRVWSGLVKSTGLLLRSF